MVKLNDAQINKKISFINYYIKASNAATGSKLDANANVSAKNIATLSAEINKDINIQINRRLIYNKLIEIFDKTIADSYINQLNKHEIYTHDESSFMPYCASVSLYPFLLNGLKGFGGESKAPKHLSSFNGVFINLIFALSSQFAGAIATVEYLMYFDYFARKEYGDNYLETHEDIITQELQQVVYALNQPASARNYQSPFWNISIYDKSYFDAMFGEFKFPDVSSPKWDTLNKLQRYFMKWFNKERTKAILTFPVVTAACLNDGKNLIDTDFQDFITTELEEGNAFFIFTSPNVYALSSCCFTDKELTLVKINDNIHLKNFNSINNILTNNDILKVLYNGNWVECELVKAQSKDIINITISTGIEFSATLDHIHITNKGKKITSELTTNDYLLYNTDILYPEESKLTEQQGMIIGLFLHRGKYISNINTSIKFDLADLYPEKRIEILDLLSLYKLNKNNENFSDITYNDKKLVELINTYITDKSITQINLKSKCFIESLEFRKGIIKGWNFNNTLIFTDTNNIDCLKSLEALIVSLGDIPIILQNNMTGRKSIHLVKSKTWSALKDQSIIKDNKIYLKINKLEYNNQDKPVYCFRIKDTIKPYFTLANGIVTHNCRLKNDIKDQLNDFSYSLGAGGVMTGSLNVITINMNRLIQNWAKLPTFPNVNNESLLNYLKTQIRLVHQYQIGFKTLFKEYLDNDLLPAYSNNFINMDKQYLTLGINGLMEGAEFLGYTINNNKEYKNFISSVLKTFSDENKLANIKYKIKFNTEFVPAENLGIKFASWDKINYLVNRNCYNSYLYPVESNDIPVTDKFILHGKDTSKYLDGGSAVHANLESYPTKEAFNKLLQVAIKEGCEYFCFNIKITICEDCGYINKQTLMYCNICKSKNINHATRVIGYLKRITDFSEARQNEEHIRNYTKTNIVYD